MVGGAAREEMGGVEGWPRRLADGRRGTERTWSPASRSLRSLNMAKCHPSLSQNGLFCIPRLESELAIPSAGIMMNCLRSAPAAGLV